MGGEGISGYGIISYGTKNKIIKMLNVILGNMVVEDRLTIRDSEDTINNMVNSLNKSNEVNLSHLVEWEYCDDTHLLEKKEDYREGTVKFGRYREMGDTCFISLDIQYWDDVDWKNMLRHISFDNILVDYHVYEDYFRGWLVLEYTFTSNVFTNKNGKVILKKPMSKSKTSPWELDFFPVHYGLVELENKRMDMDYWDFLIEESKKENYDPQWEVEKKKCEDKIKNHLSMLSHLTGLEDDENLEERLRDMEYVVSLKK